MDKTGPSVFKRSQNWGHKSIFLFKIVVELEFNSKSSTTMSLAHPWFICYHIIFLLTKYIYKYGRISDIPVANVLPNLERQKLKPPLELHCCNRRERSRIRRRWRRHKSRQLWTRTIQFWELKWINLFFKHTSKSFLVNLQQKLFM